jgi:hypothetical protein
VNLYLITEPWEGRTFKVVEATKEAAEELYLRENDTTRECVEEEGGLDTRLLAEGVNTEPSVEEAHLEK